ncbi:MAG: ATP-binding protein [Bacteroidales bacterium]
MRYLNRIIFINSAHIPLAEIKLDGNVHFIGTQGVGKSTLLRAILFFYNADKQKLGIPKEKSSFDSYYFPYSNSYIVYEVIRENGAFCVVAAKSQGRVFFRFIDSPFNRNWFLDEKNAVYSDWNRIKERIDKSVSVSSQVTSYEMYRDIIFGNNRRHDFVPFRKYAIVESAKYQNIPRTIQNVFLNTKLDADFIKDTIIRSMNDDDVAIDLDFYRNQIKSFEQEYKDVMLWFDKNSKGEIVIRKQGEKVINTYRDLLYTQQEIIHGREELNYAGRVAEEEMPLLQDKIVKKSEESALTSKSINELDDKNRKERDELTRQLGVIQDFLKRVREKQQHYERIRINEIIARVSQEDKLLAQKKQLEELKQGLMSAFNDVEQKYKLLFDNLESDFNRFKAVCDNQILEKKQETFIRKEKINNDQRAQEEEIRLSFESILNTLSERLTQIRVAQEAEKQKLSTLNLEDPFRKEKEACNKDVEQLDRRMFDLKIEFEGIKTKITSLRQEFGQKQKELEWEYKDKMDLIRKERTEFRSHLDRVSNLILRRTGSFCEWLDKNKSGWKDTIGKIAEEESILYSCELSPAILNDSDSFFGIKLNLSNIERNIRTPEDLEIERTNLQASVNTCTKRLEQLDNEKSARLSDLEKKYNSKIRDLNNDLHQKEAEQSQIPQKIKFLQAELSSIKTQENDWRESRKSEIKNRQNELAHQKIAAENEMISCTDERERKINTCRKNNKELIRDVEQKFKAFEAQLFLEIETAKQKCEKEKEKIAGLKQNELAGKGADVATISQYESEIETIAKEMDYIKNNRSQVFDYEKDKRELLNNEVPKREEEKLIKRKREDVDLKYSEKRSKLSSKLNELRNILSETKNELENIESGLKEKKEFLSNDTFCPSGSEIFRERISRKNCQFILNELKKLILSTMSKIEEFKRSVISFKGNFSGKNTFNFKLELISDTDFYDFASNLCEFIENDKISEYQKRISERYIDIIRRISKEVGDLTQHESEIIKTIKEINDDFNKRNFAGVIKEIALQADSSKDKVVQLLLEMKQFNDENQYNMGEMDLFSQDDSSREKINNKAVGYLLAFMKHLMDDPTRRTIALSDTFQLKFRVKENDNDTGWVEKIANVGSEGTDILVKAMVNIMLINVFKEKASRKFGEFRIHCMMDEIGKLHPNNVKGILEFANSRNILLINSSPTTFNAADYRYTYLLSKDGQSNTQVVPLLTNTLR